MYPKCFFVSNGPTTQYRCKDNFYMLSTVPFNLGYKTVNWSFLETGHGKGAPDGIGAVMKREADRALMHGNDITDANILHSILVDADVSLRVFFVSEADVTSCENDIPKSLNVVKGTMKIHQIFTDTPGVIHYRDVGCFCQSPNHCGCFQPKLVELQNKDFKFSASDDLGPTLLNVQDELNSSNSCDKTSVDIDESYIGQFCVVAYDGKPYPGIVESVDSNEVEVNVMHSVGENRFFWPRMQDVLWYSNENLVTLIPNPTKIGSRHHQIEATMLRRVKELLNITC